jgi:hypothetical protein
MGSKLCGLAISIVDTNVFQKICPKLFQKTDNVSTYGTIFRKSEGLRQWLNGGSKTLIMFTESHMMVSVTVVVNLWKLR